MAQPKWSITKNTESMILNVDKEQKLSYVKIGLKLKGILTLTKYTSLNYSIG